MSNNMPNNLEGLKKAHECLVFAIDDAGVLEDVKSRVRWAIDTIEELVKALEPLVNGGTSAITGVEMDAAYNAIAKAGAN